MTEARSLLFGVIADDVTGALDSGVQFARIGIETSLLLSPCGYQEMPVHVVSTHSRNTDPLRAVQAVRQAVALLHGRQLFKKLDSTMRGQVGAEIAAVQAAAGIEKAVVCPALIEAGRTVRDGRLWVGDKLLQESDFAHDPTWPAATSDLASLIGLPVTHLSLEVVRAGAWALTDAIVAAPTSVVSTDACTVADLETIGEAAVMAGVLPCGALGLARSWLRACLEPGATEPIRPRLPTCRALLIIAGSLHPRTRVQVQRLSAERGLVVTDVQAGEDHCCEVIANELAAGRSVALTTPPPADGLGSPRAHSVHEPHPAIAQLGRVAHRICGQYRPDGLFLTGGDTAVAVFEEIGASAVQIMGEFQVGIPWGWLQGGCCAELPVITKAGGFGNEEALVQIMAATGAS